MSTAKSWPISPCQIPRHLLLWLEWLASLQAARPGRGSGLSPPGGSQPLPRMLRAPARTLTSSGLEQLAAEATSLHGLTRGCPRKPQPPSAEAAPVDGPAPIASGRAGIRNGGPHGGVGGSGIFPPSKRPVLRPERRSAGGGLESAG